MAGPSSYDLRAWNTFDQKSQRTLRAGGTVTGGDGRKFVLINGHATTVGSKTYREGMARREANRAAADPKRARPDAAAPGPRPGTRGPTTGVDPIRDVVGSPPIFGTGTPTDPYTDPLTRGGAGQTGPGGGVSDAPPARSQQEVTDAAQQAAAERVEQARRNAYELLVRQFREFGLDSLAPKIMEFLIAGYDANTISLLLQDTDEYKTRFAANEDRRKKGLRVLSPAEYLSTEAAYRQALSSAGYDPSFYDSLDDYKDLIGRDVSPLELKRRADKAMKFVNDSDPAYLDAFAKFYGAGKADIAAYFLDGGRNEQLLDKRVTAAGIGAAAKRQGLAVTDVTRAEQWADQGVTEQQAQRGYEAAAQILPGQSAIANRFGEQYGQADAEDEFIGGLASARRKRDRLNRSEQSLFEGSGAVARGSLDRSASGSY